MNWNEKKIRIVLVSIMAAMLLLVGGIIVFSRAHVQADPLVLITFAINISIFFIQFLMALWKHPFSFDLMFWMFNLFFLGFAPLLQHLTNIYVWNLVPTIEEVRVNNLLIMLWTACYIAGKHLLRIPKLRQIAKKVAEFFKLLGMAVLSVFGNFWYGSRMESFCGKITRAIGSGWRKIVVWIKVRTNLKLDWMVSQNVTLNGKKPTARTRAMDRLLVVACLIFFVELISGGFTSFFTRSGGGFSTSSSALNQLLGHGTSNLLLFTAVLYGIRMKNIKRLDYKGALAFLCLLLCCFPTAIGRSSAATIYAGLMIIMIDQTRLSRWFAFVIVGGLIIVFPALEVFRSASRLQEHGFWNLLAQCFANNYLGGHYDAHQMFISIQRYTDEFGITWGRQMLGALLFFVPRAIWPNKPIGTGHMAIIALEQNEFTNVSAPLVAEGFVNFGIVGVILFGIALGALVYVLDYKYWKNEDRLSLIRIMYPFGMFQFFFILRGDMMSGWAYTFALLAVGMLVHLLVIQKTKERTPRVRKHVGK